MTFHELNLTTPLLNAIEDLELTTPTPIQEQAYSIIMSGKDVVGLAQTGTGKTLAYILPILRQLKYSNQRHPRVLVLTPTRELVTQVVSDFEEICKYMNVRVKGVFGGVSMSTQVEAMMEGCDILVATPGRLYDLILSQAIKVKSIQKFVIDEVDEMFNLGFRPQIVNILDLLPENKQSMLFSATLSEDIEYLFKEYFRNPEMIKAEGANQSAKTTTHFSYFVPNFHTKLNLLVHMIEDGQFEKVLIFVKSKKLADRLQMELSRVFEDRFEVIHSNKSQNFRMRIVEEFDNNDFRFLIATDLVARGVDFKDISHVINFDTPEDSEDFIHRIGRTGRAQKEGCAFHFVAEYESDNFEDIAEYLEINVNEVEIPEEVEITTQLIPDEMPDDQFAGGLKFSRRRKRSENLGMHKKSAKNSKVNLGGPTKRKPPKTKTINRGRLRRNNPKKK